MKPKHNFLLPDASNLLIWLNTGFLLFGIFILKWRPDTVLIVYFLETIIIGVIHVVKLWVVYKFGRLQNDPEQIKKQGATSGFIAIPFFIFHYFFFIFVQSIFIFLFIKPGHGSAFESNVFSNYHRLLAQPDVAIAFIGLAISNIGYSLKNFFLPGAYHHTTIDKLFFQPYLRIFIQQFVTILSGFFFVFSGTATIGALLLIFLRLITDLYMNATTQSKAVKEVIIHKLTKGQQPDDVKKTKESFDAFLEP